MENKFRLCVIIPSYKVTKHILNVIDRIGPEIERIYVIDDACPDKTGDWVKKNCLDPRVQIIFNKVNLGVGGAVKMGYIAAMADEIDIAIKIDGDGQMAPELIPMFLAPLFEGEADYTKGNRFYNLEAVKKMPVIRIIGNLALSFFSKFSSGYWNIFDPTNGFTAIHLIVAQELDLEKINNRYFFESDMLFRLNIVQAKIVDIPMEAHYADEVSGLKIKIIFFEFLKKHIENAFKRIFYNYFLRDFSAASLELTIGILLFTFGIVFGISQWITGSINSASTGAGTVMLAALPVLIGIQLILSFINYDIQKQPKGVLWRKLQKRGRSSQKLKVQIE